MCAAGIFTLQGATSTERLNVLFAPSTRVCCSCMSSMRLQPLLQPLCCSTHLTRGNWTDSATQLLPRLLSVNRYVAQEHTGLRCWTRECCAFRGTLGNSTKQWQNKRFQALILSQKCFFFFLKKVIFAQVSNHTKWNMVPFSEVGEESWYCQAWFLLAFGYLKTSSPKDIATGGEMLPPQGTQVARVTKQLLARNRVEQHPTQQPQLHLFDRAVPRQSQCSFS